MYSYEEVMTFIEEEDVKFIRLAFCDVFGKQKNISVMPEELKRAFSEGISFDASAIDGFGGDGGPDLFLRPDPSTLAILPWRPSHGRVVRMFCDIYYPDGRRYERDGRYLLERAVAAAAERGITCDFGSEIEFYLFRTDEQGVPTRIPYDNAGYMDIAPADRGENVRREICLTLLDMGIYPESSHHEEGPGQNEIVFRHSDPLTAANNAVTFKSVVETVATRNGLCAVFSPKPLADCSGNGLHINISLQSADGVNHNDAFMAGLLAHIREMTLFLNPERESYQRLGEMKAPKFITWSHENRSQLIRIPAAAGGKQRIELRSPDPRANPYLVYTLLIYAGLDGIRTGMCPPAATDLDFDHASPEETEGLEQLPGSLNEAYAAAKDSAFIREILPAGYIELYNR